MKVAISLPDPIFSAAEQLARELRVSRSQLYSQALSDYLDRRREPAVTERLNAVYFDQGGHIDAGLAAAQVEAIGNEAW